MTFPSFEFPVLALGPDRYWPAGANGERFYVFRDRAALSTATRDELARGTRMETLFVDNAGVARTVARTADLGAATPLWQRILMILSRDADRIAHNISCDFVEEAPIPFDSIKARVWASIERNPDDWIDDEAIAGQAGEALGLEDVLADAKAAVDRAANVKELFENLEKAWR